MVGETGRNKQRRPSMSGQRGRKETRPVCVFWKPEEEGVSRMSKWPSAEYAADRCRKMKMPWF